MSVSRAEGPKTHLVAYQASSSPRHPGSHHEIGPEAQSSKDSISLRRHMFVCLYYDARARKRRNHGGASGPKCHGPKPAQVVSLLRLKLPNMHTFSQLPAPSSQLPAPSSQLPPPPPPQHMQILSHAEQAPNQDQAPERHQVWRQAAAVFDRRPRLPLSSSFLPPYLGMDHHACKFQVPLKPSTRWPAVAQWSVALSD
ncbi:hypothetical protein CDD82_3676 [Ophiocordyceps australis]|uniref:Uncharacterized protein n=1 Tax=Ophiocordyceps australis TaxID=1399860 RepID=A0A2C5ZCC1_9HYPO|nr:hypothetical protein CDD82_3676 [Ophiocordyceps australis]